MITPLPWSPDDEVNLMPPLEAELRRLATCVVCPECRGLRDWCATCRGVGFVARPKDATS